MTFEKYATVALDTRVNKPLDYGIPKEFLDQVTQGARVIVPLKSSEEKATVLHIRAKSAVKNVQPIKQVLLSENILTPDLFQLSEWMSKYYACEQRRVIKNMMPASVRKNVKIKEQLFIKRAMSKEKLVEICAELRLSKPKQAKVLDVILKYPKGIFLSELVEKAKVSQSPIQNLIEKNILQSSLVQIDRSAVIEDQFFQTKPKTLNEQQRSCFDKICASINEQIFDVHLIHGITGSGKTEIYLQAIRYCLDQNKGVILLVPEIALTSQTIERIKSRFEERLVAIHHRLSDGERSDAWHNIRKKKVRIVIGARSAIFAPMPDIGLIIVDEEQDSSYKQTDEMPTYNARDIAVVRAKFCKACVVLGSATPSIESYHNAKLNKYRLSELHARATNMHLPNVNILDMKEHLKRTKGSMLSDPLLSKIKDRYEKGEQTLLFLNRRGYYSYQTCTSCGETLKCKHCDVSLTFHKNDNCLACHLCGFHLSPPPKTCASCGSFETMKYKGPGTEQIERTLHAIFPDIRTLRMDADTTRHKGAHDRLFNLFKSGKADVLIGTQMIAKGLHFPAVTLVGIISIDGGLHIPDFRSSEQVFQLVAQVSGRSGRGHLPGEVIIQTCLPEHPIIKLAAKERYKEFYEGEISSREMFDYPPFTHLVKVVFSGLSLEKAHKFIHEFKQNLCNGLPPSYTLTPITEAGYKKVKDWYRLQFLVKGKNLMHLSRMLKNLRPTTLPKDVKCYFDIDPISTFS